jgi:adenylate cyclase
LEAHRVERKLSAIFAADVEGYSRLMGRDEVGTLRTLTAYRVIIDRLIASHRDRIFNTAGDSILADFASAVDAVECAVAVQDAIRKENADRPVGEQMRFRIGVHVGDIIVKGDNLFGEGVNIAARLETLAEPGGICVSGTVRDQVRDKLPYALEDMSEQQVKNIARPVLVYSVILSPLNASPPTWVASDVGGLSTPATVPRLSIVVLPFANLSNDPEQEYFADGITDDLTTDLSRISGSFVIARNTAFTYKNKPVDAKQVGRELGVRYVLEGSVRRTGDRVRVNAQLIDAENGAHIWADRIDTDRSNFMQTQDEITGRLARTLDSELAGKLGRRIERESPAYADSRDLVMRGRAWWYRPVSATNRAEARRLFQQALKVDPQSVDARVGLAWVLTSSFAEGWSSSFDEDSVRAEQLLLEALEAAPNRSMAHTAMRFPSPRTKPLDRSAGRGGDGDWSRPKQRFRIPAPRLGVAFPGGARCRNYPSGESTSAQPTRYEYLGRLWVTRLVPIAAKRGRSGNRPADQGACLSSAGLVGSLCACRGTRAQG